MTHSTLVETCSHNLQTTFLPQIGVAECHTWKQLISQVEQAEEIIVRVKAEEKENKPRQEKSMRRTPEQSFQSKRKDTLTIETTSSNLNQLEGVILQAKCMPISNTLSNEHIVALFKLLLKSNKFKLPEAKRPEEVARQMIPIAACITEWWDIL